MPILSFVYDIYAEPFLVCVLIVLSVKRYITKVGVLFSYIRNTGMSHDQFRLHVKTCGIETERSVLGCINLSNTVW